MSSLKNEISMDELGNREAVRKVEAFLLSSEAQTLSEAIRHEREISTAEPVFLNVYGAQESIPRNEFRQPMEPRFLAPIDS